MVNVSELDMRGKLLYRTLTDIILQKYLAWSLHPFQQSKRSQSTWENSNQHIRLLIMSRNEEKRQAFQNR